MHVLLVGLAILWKRHQKGRHVSSQILLQSELCHGRVPTRYSHVTITDCFNFEDGPSLGYFIEFTIERL